MKEKYNYWREDREISWKEFEPDMEAILENNVVILGVNVQVGVFDKQKKEYSWENQDYESFL